MIDEDVREKEHRAHELALRHLDFYKANAEAFWSAFEEIGCPFGTFTATRLLRVMAEEIGPEKLAEIIVGINKGGQDDSERV